MVFMPFNPGSPREGGCDFVMGFPVSKHSMQIITIYGYPKFS